MRSDRWRSLTRQTWPFHKNPEVDGTFDRAAARLEVSGAGSLIGFFARLAATYAQWTDDLPGSERHHHARPFGLLIHSAETVERAFAVRGDLMDSWPPVWHPVLLALALLHDCGRLFDVEIADPDRGDGWDPLQTPLRSFRDTRFTRPVTWRAGRGFRTHEYRSLDLLPVLLGDHFDGDFKRRLEDAWLKYFDRHWRSGYVHDFPPFAVAQIVVSADQLSVQEDRRKKPLRPPPAAAANAPVDCYSTPVGPRRVFYPPFPGGPNR